MNPGYGNIAGIDVHKNWLYVVTGEERRRIGSITTAFPPCSLHQPHNSGRRGFANSCYGNSSWGRSHGSISRSSNSRTRWPIAYGSTRI